MTEQIILGILQGISEWLPVSSEGIFILAKTNLFSNQQELSKLIEAALVLHFGTFLAALIYFQKDVMILMKSIFQYKSQTKEIQNLFSFLLLSTAVSGILGLGLIHFVSQLLDSPLATGKMITVLVGCLLLVTAFLELKAHKGGFKDLKDLKMIDGVILGVVQGFAALPGFSRSGLTVSALLLRKFDKAYALKLSFLMSLPIVFLGNVILHFRQMHFSFEVLVGIGFSFLFGIVTIHGLLKLAEKINFGYFVLFFGILTILSTLI